MSYVYHHRYYIILHRGNISGLGRGIETDQLQIVRQWTPFIFSDTFSDFLIIENEIALTFYCYKNY